MVKYFQMRNNIKDLGAFLKNVIEARKNPKF